MTPTEPPSSDTWTSLWASIGSFITGAAGTMAIRRRSNSNNIVTAIETLGRTIQADGSETRSLLRNQGKEMTTTLNNLSTDLKIILDREEHRK